jgi:glutamyl-tRNA reductase
MLLVVGVSHRTAPLELRERFALDPAQWRAIAPASAACVLLSTCNRTEVYAWDSAQGSELSAQVTRALARAAGVAPSALDPHLMCRRGVDALQHLIRVVSGLDSFVIGEHQILGQVREAARFAGIRGAHSAPLEGVLSRALEAGRRVRARANPGHHSSVAALAVDIAAATPELSGLVGRGALVLGAGTMAKAATERLLANGATVTLLNRTPAHAARAARALGREVRSGPLSALPDLLAHVSVVVGATAARQAVLDVDTVHEAIAHRGGAPLVLVDLAFPRDIQPEVRALPGVRLIDLDDLEHFCPAELAEQRAEIARAEVIAAEEAEEMARWLRVRAMSSTITRVRRNAHAIRERELIRAARQLKDLTPEQHAAVEHITAAIVNKLLHGPTVALREAAAVSGTGGRSVRRVMDMLRLDAARARVNDRPVAALAALNSN